MRQSLNLYYSQLAMLNKNHKENFMTLIADDMREIWDGDKLFTKVVMWSCAATFEQE